MPPPVVIALPTPLAAWNFDENTGTTTADATGGGSTGTLSAGVSWGTGIIGSDVVFNGSTGNIAIAGSAMNFTGATPFSISLWVTLGATITQGFCGTVDSASGHPGWGFLLTSSKPTLQLFNDSASNALQVNGNSTITTGQRYHLVVTYDGSKTPAGINFYINAAVQATTTTLNTLTGSTASSKALVIGDRIYPVPTNPLNGQIDAMQIFSAVLTQIQINALNNGGNGKQYPF